MIDLSGVLLPVTTPFDPVTGDLDYVALRANLRRWLEEPVRGIVTSGSTGESVFLDESERLGLVRFARELVDAGRLLVAGTGLESTRGTIRLTRGAAEAGADAVLVQPPAYYRGDMTPGALRDHYRAIAEASPVPVILYQVPPRLSTLELAAGLVADLSTHPNIVGIKDSRGDLTLVGALLAQVRPGFQVLVGSGAHFYAGLAVGATGGILAAALLAAGEYAAIWSAHRAGRNAEAGALQERMAPVHQRIVSTLGVPGIKAALDLLGFTGGRPRPPLAPLDLRARADVKRILEAAGLARPGVSRPASVVG
ncbi:MAG: dihydrodipicolinate synthase family protein [Gemmatimonadetes bacterium]|nr:dihydrodipicolinate synthase family protein [Gemmatimonadota bacterium]